MGVLFTAARPQKTAPTIEPAARCSRKYENICLRTA